MIATLVFITTAHAQPAHLTCEAAASRIALTLPSTLTRSLNAMGSRLSRGNPRIDAILGSDWVTRVREMSPLALAEAQRENIETYNSKYKAFCRTDAVLSAMEHPDTLGYASSPALTCETLMNDLDTLDTHDLMPGIRARTGLFRSMEYQALRTALHRVAFINALTLSRSFEQGRLSFTPPTASNLNAQISALGNFSLLLNDLCQSRGPRDRAVCNTARTALARFIEQLDGEHSELCAAPSADTATDRKSAPAAGAED